MTHPSPDAGTPALPSWKPLNPRQRRVLGVLIEKAKTTPAAYPMTVNAIVVGCNQKNNREPLMNLESNDVERTLDELCTLGVVTEAPVVSRVAKYRHHSYQWLGVDRTELAVMTELLLRGEQTLGELRGRAARMEPIPDLAALKPIVDALIQRGLMIEITAPGRGQIVSHNLYHERELAELKSRYAGHVPQTGSMDDESIFNPAARTSSPEPPHIMASARTAPGPAASDATAERVTLLSSEVAELRAEVARLREQVRKLAGGDIEP